MKLQFADQAQGSLMSCVLGWLGNSSLIVHSEVDSIQEVGIYLLH